MSGFFLGKNSLRIQYAEATHDDLLTALDVNTAYSVMRARRTCQITLISNQTAATIAIGVVHPEADGGNPANRLFAFEVPPGYGLNFDTMNFTVEAGTSIFAWNSSGASIVAPTKLRIFGWG